MRQNRDAYLGQTSCRSKDRTPRGAQVTYMASPSFSQTTLDNTSKSNASSIQHHLKQTIMKQRAKGRTGSGWGFKTIKQL